jgi:hypothetical protein
LKIYINFNDYKRAFDSVEKKFVPHSPKNQGVYDKYITTIKDIYIHICAKIKIESEGKTFRLERGGKKGDPISSHVLTCLLEHIFIQGREQQTVP